MAAGRSALPAQAVLPLLHGGRAVRVIALQSSMVSLDVASSHFSGNHESTVFTIIKGSLGI